jgi:hypothetical protein
MSVGGWGREMSVGGQGREMRVGVGALAPAVAPAIAALAPLVSGVALALVPLNRPQPNHWPLPAVYSPLMRVVFSYHP